MYRPNFKMDDYCASEDESVLSVDLNMSCSSSPFELSDREEEEASLGIRPYQFEPYQVGAENEFQGEEGGDGLTETDEEGSNGEAENRLVSRDWCQCGNCEVMPTARECLCCKEVAEVSAVMEEFPEVSCITHHPGFQPVCLDIYVLRTAYYSYRQHYNEGMDDSPERNRHIAYRQFVRWCWGYLGRHNRVIIPSCTVEKIRRTFPSQEPYTGFQEN